MIGFLAVGCILMGVCLLGFGYAMGGRLHSGWGVRFGNPFGIGFVGTSDNDVDGIKLGSGNETRHLDAFEAIDIDVSIGDIVVEDGEDYTISIQNMEEEDYTLTQNGGMLHFVFDKNEWNVFNFSSNDYKVVVTIPENKTMKEIKVDSSMGDIEVRNVDCKSLTLDQAMGEVDVKNVIVEGDTSIEQNMGDIDIKGSLRGKSDIKNHMGDISIEIQKDAKDKFYYHLKSSMGDLEVDKKSTSDGFSASLEGGSTKADYQIIADNSMGDISLEFEDD